MDTPLISPKSARIIAGVLSVSMLYSMGLVARARLGLGGVVPAPLGLDSTLAAFSGFLWAIAGTDIPALVRSLPVIKKQVAYLATWQMLLAFGILHSPAAWATLAMYVGAAILGAKSLLELWRAPA
jgi:hypothetical protein